MIKDNRIYAGNVKILQNGKPLPEFLLSTISEVSVEDKLNEASTFTVNFRIGDFIKQMKSEKIDVDVFKTGDELRLEMGFDQTQPLMVGEVTSIEPTFQEPFLLEIRGYDRLFKLTLGARIFSYEKQKDSDIAAQIAKNNGLAAQADDTAVVYPHLLQNNKSDYRFLLERARRIGYEILVDDKTLIYRKSRESSAPSLSLTYGVDLHNFSIRVKAVPKGTRFESRGWDVMGKKEFSYTADQGKEPPERELYPCKGGGKISPPVIEEAALDASDAEVLATARFNAVMSDTITGDGRCCGNPALCAGKTIKLGGIGDRLSGIYYVTSSVHTVGDEGYVTRFKVRKVAK